MSQDTTSDRAPNEEAVPGADPALAAPLPSLDPEVYFDSLMGVAEEHFRDRRRAVEAVNTVAEWAERRPALASSLAEMMGGLPERTPLNARVVDRTVRSQYLLERVLFESRPRFVVTANLYLPLEQDAPAPGILIPCGHAAEGKAYETYRRAAVHLAMKGFAVLVYDPVGQGERVQYWTDDGSRPLLGAGTAEHFADGNLCYLLGTNLAQFRVWDGMRALDYLCTRPEVDANRLGCTGNSGGGTLTTYLAAMDNRLKAVAPCCYVTTLRRRFLSRQIADPEQNLLPLVAAGMEIADLLALFAPRPLLIGAARQDFFPIEGARHVRRELRTLYRLFGMEDRLAMVEVDEPHGWTLGLRQAACAWMIRWLGTRDDSPLEPQFELPPQEATWCFPNGNVYLHLRGTSVSDMLANRMRELQGERAGQLASVLTPHDCASLRNRVRRAIRCPEPPPAPTVVRGPRREREWGTAEELHLHTEATVVVPATLCLPANAEGSLPAAVLTHASGRSELTGADGLGARLAAAGVAALCVDPRGVGETRSQLDDTPGQWRHDRDAELAYVALMSGVVPVGRRVQDLWSCLGFLRTQEAIDPARVGLVGCERAGLWVAHLAALAGNVAFAAQLDTLACYECLFSRPDYRAHIADFVPRALLEYDLPHLAALLAPTPQLLLNPKCADGENASADEIEAFYAQARGTYEALESEAQLTIGSTPAAAAVQIVVDWVCRQTQVGELERPA